MSASSPLGSPKTPYSPQQPFNYTDGQLPGHFPGHLAQQSVVRSLSFSAPASPAMSYLPSTSSVAYAQGPERLSHHISGSSYVTQPHTRASVAYSVGSDGVMRLNGVLTGGAQGGADLDLLLHRAVSMHTLLLGNNELAQRNICALGEALEQTDSLQVLSLEGTPLEQEGVEGIVRGLGANISLNTLNLSGVTTGAKNSTFFGDDLVEALLPAIESNDTLQVLLLRSNLITNVGAESIANALLTNSSLTEVDLRGNLKIDPVLMLKIRSSAMENKENAFYRKFYQEKLEDLTIQERGSLYYQFQLLNVQPAFDFADLDSHALRNLGVFWKAVVGANLQDRFENMDPKTYEPIESPYGSDFEMASADRIHLAGLRQQNSLNKANEEYRAHCMKIYAGLSQDEKDLLETMVWRQAGMPQELGYGRTHMYDDWQVFWEAVLAANLQEKYVQLPPAVLMSPPPISGSVVF